MIWPAADQVLAPDAPVFIVQGGSNVPAPILRGPSGTIPLRLDAELDQAPAIRRYFAEDSLEPGQYELVMDDGEHFTLVPIEVALEPEGVPGVTGLTSEAVIDRSGLVELMRRCHPRTRALSLSWAPEVGALYQVSWESTDGAGHQGRQLSRQPATTVGRGICLSSIPNLAMGDELRIEVAIVGPDGELGEPAVVHTSLRQSHSRGNCSTTPAPIGLVWALVLPMLVVWRRR